MLLCLVDVDNALLMLESHDIVPIIVHLLVILSGTLKIPSKVTADH